MTISTAKEDLKSCDVVIEAIVEDIEIKKIAFKELNELCSPITTFVTNTSGFSITEIAAASGRANQFIGMHFFNPVPLMRLVEIIPGIETSQETIDLAMKIGKEMGKTPIKAQNKPGFIVNRILVPYLNEAMFAYQEGVAEASDIDEAMKLGANMPIGPLALCDLIGLDTLLLVIEYFHKEFGESKFRPPHILKEKVRAGHLGAKTGRGFFNYQSK